MTRRTPNNGNDMPTNPRLAKLRPIAADHAEAREASDRAEALRRIARRYRAAAATAPHEYRAAAYRRRIDALYDTASWWR
jgi:hypothetical protein